MRTGLRTAALGAVVALAGCTPLAGPVESSSDTPPPATTGSGAAPTTAPNAAHIVVADGHGWTSAGLDGPIPAPGSCHMRTAADGEPLPDPACTPGAVDSVVTDSNISSTVCRKGGYTSSVRPPERLTNAAKTKLLAAYGIPAGDISKYELDHLIELASGGASDIRNLWPEPNTFKLYRGSAFVHNDKDRVESYLYDAVCQHKVTVSAVESAVASDWTTAVDRLGLPPIATS